jgi:predicted ATPase
MLSQWLELQALGGAQRSRAKESATRALEDERIERVERALASAGLKLHEAVPLVAELLQLPVAERYAALTMAPEQKRQRLFAVLMRWVFGAAWRQPVAMVVEDLHWLDPSTLELLQLLTEQGGDGAADAALYGEAGVSSAVADAGASCPNHAQPAERGVRPRVLP